MPNNPPSKSHFEQFLENRSSWQIGVILLALGVILLGVPWPIVCGFYLEPFFSHVGEAVVVAGVLACFVDPFLKARLLRDAARSIFEHILGFDHEPELKAKLREIVNNTTLYRRDFELECKIGNSTDSPGMVQLLLSTQYEVLNPTLGSLPHRVPLTFVKAEKPEACEVTQIIGDNEPEVSSPALKEAGSAYVTADTPSIDIEPRSKGKRYRFVAKCGCEAPKNWFHTVYFGYPTIDAVITVKAPEGWRVWVGGQEDKNQNSAHWHNPGLFMPGDKVELHWREPE